MRLPTLWSSNDPFRALQREMDDFFRSFGRQFPSAGAGGMDMRVPAMNVSETDNAIEVTAELPGVDDKDLKVSIDGNRLYISGEKKQEREDKEKDWHVVERSFGSFQRSLTLPFEPQEEGRRCALRQRRAASHGEEAAADAQRAQRPSMSALVASRPDLRDSAGGSGLAGRARQPGCPGGSNENQERKAG